MISLEYKIIFLSYLFKRIKKKILVTSHWHILAAVCQAGFTGKYCEEQCKFPNYGYGCQQRCLCPKTSCDLVHGCSKRKPSKFLKKIFWQTNSVFFIFVLSEVDIFHVSLIKWIHPMIYIFLFTTDITRPYLKTKSRSASMEKTATAGRRPLQIVLTSNEIHMSYKQ